MCKELHLTMQEYTMRKYKAPFNMRGYVSCRACRVVWGACMKGKWIILVWLVK